MNEPIRMTDPPKTFYIVYETRNLVNGKVYRGAHKTKRLNDCYLGSGRVFTHAIKKYGTHNFKRYTLAHAKNEKEMYYMESILVSQKWLNEMGEKTYNIACGGVGGEKINPKKHVWTDEEKQKVSKRMKGSKHSPEHCKKMSDIFKGRKLSPEHVKKVADKKRGSKHSEESKRKMSETHKATPFTEEHRQNVINRGRKTMSIPENLERFVTENKNRIWTDDMRKKHGERLIGKKLSEETKKKISDARKGKPRPKWTDEQRRKIMDSKKDFKYSEETKRKMAEQRKSRVIKPISEETKKKMSEAHKKRLEKNGHSEETKRKISETNKKTWETRRLKLNSTQKINNTEQGQ